MNSVHMNEPVERSDSVEEFSRHYCGNIATTSWQKYTFEHGEEGSGAKLTVVIPVRYCKVCDESFIDREAEEIQHRAVCEHFGVLAPEEISAIRRKYGLTRAAFAQLSGIGEASLSRWEKGLIIQNLANDRYLRLLQKPENLSELRLIDALAPLTDEGRLEDCAKFPNLCTEGRLASSMFQLCKAS